MSKQITKKETINERLLTVNFPWGMPGLEYNEYLLQALSEESPFFFLQSIEEPQIGLLLINPFIAFSDYEFDLSDEVAGQMKIDNQSGMAVLCTVNTSKGIDSATVNLLAPIIINIRDQIGKQVVLNEKKYSLRTPLTIIREKSEER